MTCTLGRELLLVFIPLTRGLLIGNSILSGSTDSAQPLQPPGRECISSGMFGSQSAYYGLARFVNRLFPAVPLHPPYTVNWGLLQAGKTPQNRGT